MTLFFRASFKYTSPDCLVLLLNIYFRCCSFSYSPSKYLQHPLFHPSRVLESSSSVWLRYFGKFSGWGCVPARVFVMFSPRLSEHVPSISPFNRQGLCGRRISFFPLRLHTLWSRLSYFPSFKSNKNTFHTQFARFFPPIFSFQPPSLHFKHVI